MNIFAESDYRKILRDAFNHRKRAGEHVTYDVVAAACRVQKTLISRIFNRQAHCNHDQLFAFADFFGFNAETQDYLSLLLDHSRAVTKPRQQYLKHKIETVQAAKRDTRAYVGPHQSEIDPADARYQIYYLEPLHQIVHVSLDVPRYRECPAELGRILGIPAEKFERILQTLKELAVIAYDGKQAEVLITDLYLPRDHCHYQPWRSMVRSLAAARLQTTPEEGTYSFSATFSASREARLQLQHQFLAFLQSVKPLVTESPAEDCFQMNFDLFAWTR